jgi:hypothetical protein
MNRHAASSEAHVAVARRPGDVPVLHWTKNHRIPLTKSGNNERSTTFGPASMLQSTHLAPAPAPPWITMGTSNMSRNRSRQIWRTTRRPHCWSKGSTSTLCHQLWDVAMRITTDVGVELRQIYLPGYRSHHLNDAPQQTSPNPNYKIEERDPFLLPPATGAASGGRGDQRPRWRSGDLGIRVALCEVLVIHLYPLRSGNMPTACHAARCVSHLSSKLHQAYMVEQRRQGIHQAQRSRIVLWKKGFAALIKIVRAKKVGLAPASPSHMPSSDRKFMTRLRTSSLLDW